MTTRPGTRLFDPVIPPCPQKALARFHMRVALPRGWGFNDCMIAAADAVRDARGIDLAALFRGRYTTYRGGIRILRKAGCKNFRDAVGMVARQAGAVPAGKLDEPQDFDFGLLALATDKPGHVGIQAVFYNSAAGMWLGMTETSMLAWPELPANWWQLPRRDQVRQVLEVAA